MKKLTLISLVSWLAINSYAQATYRGQTGSAISNATFQGTFYGDGGGLTNVGAGSTTITNTTSAAGLVVGGSGSFGIGTNLTSVAGGTNQFWIAASPPNEKYTNLFGDIMEISGAYRVLTVGTNVGNNVQISDGISSFPNGMWIDAGAQEYFVGKISVGTSRGQFQLGSGAVSNLTSTGVIYAPSNNITGGISAASITVGTSPTKITIDGTTGSGGFADTVYPTNATASRMAFIGPSKAITNAGASGAIPINADGSASTSAQIGSLFTGGSTYLKADGTTGTGGGGGVALLQMSMRGQTITATGSGKNWPADMSYVSSSTSIYRTAVPAGTYTNFIGFWNAASSAGTNFWFNCQTNGVTAFAWNLGGTGGSGVSTQLIGGFTLTARGTINWVITNNSAGDFDGASFYGTYQYTP